MRCIYVKKVYERLKADYLEIMCNTATRMKYNPPKNNFEMGDIDGIVTKSTNVMSAQTKNGVFTKVISIDDVSGKVNESIIYTDNALNTYHYENIGLTTTRCALMACLAADLNIDVNQNIKVGFIGNGKINLRTCEMFNELFGVHNFVIRGSQRNRGKNAIHFEQFGEVKIDDTESLLLLNSCDVVVCCTNSFSKDEVIENFEQLNYPELIIAQDGGYVLGESFRRTRGCFTDHAEQLHAHYFSEFPFDKYEQGMLMMKDKRNERYPKSVYLYGIALADAIVFEELYLKENKI